MQPPLINDLGYLAKTEAAEQVLNGCYEPAAEVDKYAKELIQELRRPAIVCQRGPIPISSTPAEHIAG
jgi:hypothetical protein